MRWLASGHVRSGKGWMAHQRDARCVRGRERPGGVSVGVRGVLRNVEGAWLVSGEVL
jgi:hypothetical protein